jgi:quinol monooxygenase YgiN
MAEDTPKAKRILHVKVKTPSADATSLLTTMMKNALPLYKAFGEAQVRLLRNADDQTQFLQVIEYQTDQAIEFNRQKLASDPLMQNYLQAWRTLFPGAMEIDVYEDVTEKE